MAKGYVAFVLHAHLPFVRHPEYDHFLEERWLFEAMTETYIPLLQRCEKLAAERVPFQLNLSISPSLLAMLEDPLLQQRYRQHLASLIRLAEQEQQRNEHHGHLRWLAGLYRTLFAEAGEVFERWQGRLALGFKQLHEWGVIELMTTTATHGILPLLATQPAAVRAQVVTGLDYFASVFGFRPAGMWLPECAWTPALGEVLREEGVRYLLVEAHGVEHARVMPLHGLYAPIYTRQGIAAFARDRGSTKEVWSAREGYPGDPAYREFYRDIGHDLDFDYIRSFIPGDVRAHTGIKYHRITGPTAHKDLYNPDVGRERAAQHAGVFLSKRVAHVEYLSSTMSAPPIITAPFDAELFGHWWFEGPQWLDYVIRKAAFDQNVIELISLGRYLDKHPVQQLAEPATSSWGHKGYFETWLNGGNDWIFNHLIECGKRMGSLVEAYGQQRKLSTLEERALNQCLRELLLAQSSDWPFIIANGTSATYATRRVKDHVTRFHALADGLEALGRTEFDQQLLVALEYIDNIFPQLDFRNFSTKRS